MPALGTPKASGDLVDQHALKNRLLLITVTEIVRGMVTKATKAGETTDAVRCDIVALDNGDEHSDALLFGKMLVSSFDAGVTYLGQLTKVDGKTEGRDHPWLFEGLETDPASVAAAQGYYAYKATKAIATPVAAAPAAPAPAPVAAAPVAAAPAAAPAAPPWATA